MVQPKRCWQAACCLTVAQVNAKPLSESDLLETESDVDEAPLTDNSAHTLGQQIIEGNGFFLGAGVGVVW